MITSKQRSFLRSKANSLPSMVQIGKENEGNFTLDTLNNYFVRNELVKINVLKTCTLEPKVLATELSHKLEAEIVAVIGRKIVLYRYNKELAKLGKSLVLPA